MSKNPTPEQEIKIQEITEKNLKLNVTQVPFLSVKDAIDSLWAHLKKAAPVVILADGPQELARMTCACYLMSTEMDEFSSKPEGQLKIGDKTLALTYKKSFRSQLEALKLPKAKFWQLYKELYEKLFVCYIPKMRAQLDSQQTSKYLEDNTRKIWDQFLPEVPVFEEYKENKTFAKEIDAYVKKIKEKYTNHIAINNCIWTRTWANHYEINKMLGVEFPKEQYDLFEKVAWNIPLVASYDEIAIVSRNPTEVNHIGTQLHNESGPAIAFADGYKVYAIGGIVLDEQIVMRPETQTVKQIEAETNQDIKSIRAERFGYARLVKEGKYELIDERENDIEGTIEALYKTPNGFNCLIANCPSGKLVALPVRPDSKKCEDVANWLNPFSRDRKSRLIGRT